MLFFFCFTDLRGSCSAGRHPIALGIAKGKEKGKKEYTGRRGARRFRPSLTVREGRKTRKHTTAWQLLDRGIVFREGVGGSAAGAEPTCGYRLRPRRSARSYQQNVSGRCACTRCLVVLAHVRSGREIGRPNPFCTALLRPSHANNHGGHALCGLDFEKPRSFRCKEGAASPLLK